MERFSDANLRRLESAMSQAVKLNRSQLVEIAVLERERAENAPKLARLSTLERENTELRRRLYLGIRIDDKVSRRRSRGMLSFINRFRRDTGQGRMDPDNF